MTTIISKMDQFVAQAKQAERTATADTNRHRYKAYEDIYVSLCILRLTAAQLEYHQARTEWLGSGIDELKKFENFDSFPAFYGEIGGSTKFVLGDEWTFLRNRSVFHLPFDLYPAGRAIFERWAGSMSSILEHLQNHPALQGLPQVEYEGKGSDPYSFEFFFRVETGQES